MSIITEWSMEDHMASLREGWMLRMGDDEEFHVRRVCSQARDDLGELASCRFLSDEEALLRVRDRAAAGSDLHRRALIMCGEEP